jgi:ATP-binding cassette subfamily F protein uup
MPILTLARACLAFGHVSLLEHAELQIDAAERVCLVGRNGSGKSSLLQVLSGVLALDDGIVWRKPGMRIGYVAQELVFHGARTVFDAVAQGAGETCKLIIEYYEVAHRVGDDPPQELLDRLHGLQAELERADGWQYNNLVEQTLTQLALDGDAPLETLSGGGLTRVALARALVGEPELLLLDEPTNHLDLETIRWIEQILCALKGSLVVVTHDRRFLDAVATRIVELDRGRLTSYSGTLADFERRRGEMLDAQARQTETFDKLLALEEAWIRKGVEARRTRNEGRVRRLEELRRQRAVRRERLGTVGLQLSCGEGSGRAVAELEHVSKRFNGRPVVRDFSCRVLRGDRIGIIRSNGAGKTTLLKLILGALAPDEGRVCRGTRLSVAYFDQFRAALDEEASLADVISQGADYLDVGGVRKHVISYLGEFLFPPQRARSPVKSLSGGERNRLLLARLFSKPANVLVLDEPTNEGVENPDFRATNPLAAIAA